MRRTLLTVVTKYNCNFLSSWYLSHSIFSCYCLFKDATHCWKCCFVSAYSYFISVLGDGDKSIYSYFGNTPKLFHRRQRIDKKYLREYGEYEGLTIRPVSIPLGLFRFFENSRRYSRKNVYQWCQRHR
jgi:hypothetical protein